MEERNIYKDIAMRTEGNIYIGVAGPVRTGKSTFIKRFMDTLVIPNIENQNRRERAVDELPQSSAGRTVMTTEPKFIPEDAVEIMLNDTARLNVRMIDCVGYIVPAAIGYLEDEQPRMVKTPWFENEIPFNEAAEIGTRKVIMDHSTVGIVITTDGSIADIPRYEYEEAESKVIMELKSINKPFVVLLNSAYPNSEETLALADELVKKYKVPVMPVSCPDLDETEIKRILATLLFEFPVQEIKVNMPKWINLLDKNHKVRKEILSKLKDSSEHIEKIRQISLITDTIPSSEYITEAITRNIDLGTGNAEIEISLRKDLYFKILGEKTELEINDESDLLDFITDFTETKKQYEKLRVAYEQVNETGYGIVMPSLDELTLAEPEIIRQGGKYGVRLKASAPSIHMMKTNIKTEVTPIVGSEQQSEELVMYLLKEFEENPLQIWNSNIFGKSLHELVTEGLHNKLNRMPDDARKKLNETVERIINDGCNGLICIIL